MTSQMARALAHRTDLRFLNSPHRSRLPTTPQADRCIMRRSNLLWRRLCSNRISNPFSRNGSQPILRKVAPRLNHNSPHHR